MSGIDPSEQKQAFLSLQATMKQYQADFGGFIHNQQDSLKSFLKEASEQQFSFLDHSVEKYSKAAEKISADIRRLAKSTSSELKEHLSSVADAAEDSSDKAHKHVRKHAEKHISSLKESLKKFAPGELAESFGEVATEAAPALGWAYVVKTMADLSEETSGLLRTMGGSKERLAAFTDSMSELQTQTHLSNAAIVELATAFQEDGLSLDKNTADMKELLEVSGQAMHFLGLSAETASKYGMNMREMGKSSKDVAASYDDLYQIMQRNNLSITDMADAISGANTLFENFATTSGKGVGELSKDLLETKGLFRSLGEDSRQAGAAIAAELGNVDHRMQEAGMMQALLGGDVTDYFNKLPTAEGQMAKKEAAMRMMLNQAGPTALVDPSKLTGSDLMQHSVRMSYAADTTSHAFGIESGTLQKELAEYLADRKAHPEMNPHEFFEEKLKEHQSHEPLKTWQDANSSFNSSFGQLGKNLEHTLNSIAMILGGPLMKVINPLVEGLNWLLDSFIDLEEKNPMVKSMTELGVIAVTVGAALGPLTAAFGAVSTVVTGLIESVGVVGGAFEAIGAVISGLVEEFAPSIGAGIVGGAKNSSSLLLVATPLLGLFFDKLGAFLTNFLPEWIKKLWEDFSKSDIGRTVTGFSQHPLESAGNAIQSAVSGFTDLMKTPGPVTDSGVPITYQGQKSPKGLNVHAMENAAIVANEARKSGADPATAIAAMLQESGGNNRAVGDFGTSFGLFQLHKGGELGALSAEQAFDPKTNAHVALQGFAANLKKHPDWSPGQIAASAQRPADQFHYAQSVNKWMPTANKILVQLQSPSISREMPPVETPNIDWYRKQQGGITDGVSSDHHEKHLNAVLEQNDLLKEMLKNQKKQIDDHQAARNQIRRDAILNGASAQSAAQLSSATGNSVL